MRDLSAERIPKSVHEFLLCMQPFCRVTGNFTDYILPLFSVFAILAKGILMRKEAAHRGEKEKCHI